MIKNAVDKVECLKSAQVIQVSPQKLIPELKKRANRNQIADWQI